MEALEGVMGDQLKSAGGARMVVMDWVGWVMTTGSQLTNSFIQRRETIQYVILIISGARI